MDLRQTAVNTLSYQLDGAPKLRPPARRHRGLEPRSADVHAAPGPAAGRGGPNDRQGWSEAVGQALNRSRRRRTNPIEVSGRPRGATATWSGRIVSTTFFSLRLRVAQHSTYRLAAET
jgi:hypothetical protein